MIDAHWWVRVDGVEVARGGAIGEVEEALQRWMAGRGENDQGQGERALAPAPHSAS